MPESAARRVSGRIDQKKKSVLIGKRRNRARGSPSCRSRIPVSGPDRRRYATMRPVGSHPALLVRASPQAPSNLARHWSFEALGGKFHLLASLAPPPRNRRLFAATASATGAGPHLKLCRNATTPPASPRPPRLVAQRSV